MEPVLLPGDLTALGSALVVRRGLRCTGWAPGNPQTAPMPFQGFCATPRGSTATLCSNFTPPFVSLLCWRPYLRVFRIFFLKKNSFETRNLWFSILLALILWHRFIREHGLWKHLLAGKLCSYQAALSKYPIPAAAFELAAGNPRGWRFPSPRAALGVCSQHWDVFPPLRTAGFPGAENLSSPRIPAAEIRGWQMMIIFICVTGTFWMSGADAVESSLLEGERLSLLIHLSGLLPPH